MAVGLKDLGAKNGLCMSSRACTPMLAVLCGSMVNTVRNVCIKAFHPGAGGAFE